MAKDKDSKRNETSPIPTNSVTLTPYSVSIGPTTDYTVPAETALKEMIQKLDDVKAVDRAKVVRALVVFFNLEEQMEF